ncbi:ATP-binding cassette domain-containing protein [Streptomyces sp. NPDC047046]|uniref:ATP-binding cassette domain-containing protein n=1 Tax=Streptomyces sp. NPDC047046 TaxID=3155378 RepID=UPI0033D11298
MTAHPGPGAPAANAAPVLVDVRDLRKSYAGRPVVDGVTFRVHEGEVFGVLGPNGAGKTTTVECVAGLRVPDGGSVRVAGLDPGAEHPPVSRLLGVQLQESALPPKITVREALLLYASFHPAPADWRALAKRPGLGDRLDARWARSAPEGTLMSATATATVLRTEARLFLREPAGSFWSLLFPTLLLTILGLVPFFRTRHDGLDGLRIIDLYVPVAVLLALVATGLQVMPGVLGVYRESARLLFLSEATVKTHLTHLHAELGATDRAAAVARGYEQGILGTGRAGT